MSEDREQERIEFIQSLRDLATFLEDHPVVRTPRGGEMMNVFVDDKEDITEMARATSWEKVYLDNWFVLRRSFGKIDLDVTIARSAVCRKVVTGTRIVEAQPEREVETFEWVCDEPLLAGETS